MVTSASSVVVPGIVAAIPSRASRRALPAEARAGSQIRREGSADALDHPMKTSTNAPLARLLRSRTCTVALLGALPFGAAARARRI